jgi:two-component system sensor histidine kinase UhpB
VASETGFRIFMSLRVRLIAYVAAVLLASLALGAGLTWWTARISVVTEMDAALAVAERTVESALATLSQANDPGRELDRLIAAFDGDRHVRATLIDMEGGGRSSTMAGVPGEGAPAWFVNGIGVGPVTRRIAVPSANRAILLETDPRNEVHEIWNSSRGAMLVMAVFCALTGVLIYVSLGRALRSLADLSGALGRVGAGRYDDRLSEDGPAELASLARAFNRMAGELGAVHAQNRQLHEQLLTLQEAERAELARDLHDEVGPFLFAVGIDAAGIERAAKQGKGQDIPVLVQSIREAIAHMQRHVRAIMGRLRPVGLEDFGLAQAIENLIDFWRRRHPEIAFAVVLDIADGYGDVLDATIYRVVQEALSNALRHGHPTRIEVTIKSEPGGLIVSVADDGEGAGDVLSPGFGLTGMRERVAATGGMLELAARPEGGMLVTARIPSAALAELRVAS